ncbi:LytTR family DNA-binding domain-containing protein [Aquimarina gracilis]|uniref:LytTR family DNA-binding domain-containing protein n=1 Tax=Aquimarina gracilis TaxID=874422 RepID=A0ABU5ZX37_9FLAO|nr:LytTR family DNA-binding domain-containing protein [Aquimarina gracilis]MEB3346422.1 LytTR family DNA-binding domain-containing protein [Aquimarina gracilis]
MNIIVNLWKTPVSVIKTKKEKWYIILFLTLYVPVFLLIFQPFGVNNYNPTHKINLDLIIGCLGFGLISGIVISIHEFLVVPYFLKKKTRFSMITKWSFVFISLPFLIYLFYNLLGGFHDWKWSSFLGFIRDVFLMSILPMSIIIMYNNYISVKKANHVLLKGPIVNNPKMQLINIESNNCKDSIILSLDALLYVKAQDNYVDIYYLKDNQVKKQLLRVTMKALALKLKEKAIIRCHRSYLVNMNKVIKIDNNGYQMQLLLSNIKNPIPISRSYINSVKELVTTYHK